jgi:cytochrome c peroxidase
MSLNGPLIALIAALCLSACGGGSGSPASPGSSSIPPPPVSPPPASPPPASPLPPVLNNPIQNQHAVFLHPYRFDVSQGGTTFSDPYGTGLTYQITIGHTYSPTNDPNPPAGLSVEGTVISGAPSEVTIAVVTVTVTDQAGQTANNEFNIIVQPNTAPIVAQSNDGVLVSVGQSFNYETTKSGAAFTDADGDPLTYTVTLRGSTPGISVTGTHVSGSFSTPGIIEVTVTASDAYGGSVADVFAISAPAAVPGRPTLPTQPYAYADTELTLPYVFQLSSQIQIPLWDSQPSNNRTTDAGATLGRVLFYDKRLSSTNLASCATCHQHDYAFTSPTPFVTGPLGVPTARNVMALANVRYNIDNAWFSDMRVNTLHELALQPIQKPAELGMSLRLLVPKLAATDYYPPLFQAAFGSPEITADKIGLALEQYLQALISYRSRADQALNTFDNSPADPSQTYTAQEMRGLAIFNGAGGIGCTGCHEQAAATNVWQANNGLDLVPTDPGTTVPALQRDGSVGIFRAASLRNIALTAPYMHDGRFATLRDVIDHYDHGIVDSRDLDGQLRDSTGAVRRMNLSEGDKQALEAFLDTYTDSAMLSDPKFKDPFP